MDILNWILHNPWFALLGTITLIQVAPIKLDPWSWIGKQFRKFFVGDIEEQLKDIRGELDNVQKSMIEDKVESTRWNVLNFANSCRQNKKHTKEEWEHCIDSLYWYENYCVENNITNGVMQECEGYLKSLFRKLMEKDDFL